jgi:hypothetical protein
VAHLRVPTITGVEVCTLEASSGEAPVGSSAGEDADGGQCDMASSGAWSAHSIASRTRAERRPERI